MIRRISEALLTVSGAIFLVLTVLTAIGAVLIMINGGRV